MNILILGNGGRESAFAWKVRKSPFCKELFIAPGNAGTAQYGANLNIDTSDFEQVKEACILYQIDILIPGGEDTLVAGIYDFIKNDPETKHIIVVGPSREAAKLEGSKSFSKGFMARHGIPTAAYAEFDIDSFDTGAMYIKSHSLPIVLKADGLAAGKGVIIAEDTQDALNYYKEMLKNALFGAASKKIVVEEFLEGIELSIFVFTDGSNYVILPDAKDYKKVGEGDTGPNTGGMGAISPVPFVDDAFLQKVINRIIEPTIQGLKSEKRFYQGFLFFGLINVQNNPYVIEYNCRMGDPETEVVLPRLENDLVEMFQLLPEQKVNELEIKHTNAAAATVMLVSGGYPGDYEKGKVITGIDSKNDSIIFQSATKMNAGDIQTNGGRVLSITSIGNTLQEALDKSYQTAEKIDFEGKYYRKDIGFEFK